MMHAPVFGWDVGGAHLKACRLQGGVIVDAAQWACPLWTGISALEEALAKARARWPEIGPSHGGEAPLHAVTMTGEMVDAFTHREAGVQQIASLLERHLARSTDAGPSLHFFAGDHGWCRSDGVARAWPHIASANWLATALLVAASGPATCAVLVDIGSTTTDLIAVKAGRVVCTARSDAERLASGELFYQGVVRTPLCAVAPRIEFGGSAYNVMNELFATTADAYRLLGELDPRHDVQPPADGARKDAPATRQRLARMIGMDAGDGQDGLWLDNAAAWRARQVQAMAAQLERVMVLQGLGPDTQVVSAGCGDFLVPEVARLCGLGAPVRFATHVARCAPGDDALPGWIQVCAPSVAVAALLHLHAARPTRSASSAVPRREAR